MSRAVMLALKTTWCPVAQLRTGDSHEDRSFWALRSQFDRNGKMVPISLIELLQKRKVKVEHLQCFATSSDYRLCGH